MIGIPPGVRILIAMQPVDFRRGADSLAALAKEALARKKEHEALANTLKDQWQKQKQAVDQLKTALRLLNNKIEEAKRKRNILIARQKRAEAQKTIQSTMAGLSDTSAFDTFDRMAEKVDAIEAEFARLLGRDPKAKG